MLQVAPAGYSFPAVEHGAGGRACDDSARKEDGREARTIPTGTTHSQSEDAAEAEAASTAGTSGRAEAAARKAGDSGGVHLCAAAVASVPAGVPLI